MLSNMDTDVDWNDKKKKKSLQNSSLDGTQFKIKIWRVERKSESGRRNFLLSTDVESVHNKSFRINFPPFLRA